MACPNLSCETPQERRNSASVTACRWVERAKRTFAGEMCDPRRGSVTGGVTKIALDFFIRLAYSAARTIYLLCVNGMTIVSFNSLRMSYAPFAQ